MITLFSFFMFLAHAQNTPAPSVTVDEQATAVPVHKVVRRVAVFPIAAEEYRNEADAAWWSIREFLANSERFLVATKRFMTQKDTYQPRKTIIPTDVILLARVLDADCIISTFVQKDSLKMAAYSGDDGFLLWENSVALNPSLPVGKQLDSLGLKLVKDFLSTFPYQGFQITDPLIGKPVFEEGDVTLAKIDIGAKATIQPGESVQWVRLERQSAKALFQGGGLLKVVAEGNVVKVENQTALVEIKRLTDVRLLDEKSTVSFPNEFSRLHSQFALTDPAVPKISTAMLSAPMYPTETKSAQSRPLLTSLASVASLVALILLAF